MTVKVKKPRKISVTVSFPITQTEYQKLMSISKEREETVSKILRDSFFEKYPEAKD